MRVLPRLRALTRRVTGEARLRAAISRVLLRADEIVPFGTGLAFDPHTWVMKQTEYGFRIWVALGERSISREILLDRYERDEVEIVRANVKPGDRVVDIGANIGFYTALLATLVGPGGHVIACEPLDAVADALERTVAENAFAQRVTLHRIALDAHSGSILLRHAPITINQGAAYLAPASALPPGHVDATVQARTLDEIVGDAPCAFVKLDAEGAEPRILMGAVRTLTRCRPSVLAELNPEHDFLRLTRTGDEQARASEWTPTYSANFYGNLLRVIVSGVQETLAITIDFPGIAYVSDIKHSQNQVSFIANRMAGGNTTITLADDSGEYSLLSVPLTGCSGPTPQFLVVDPLTRVNPLRIIALTAPVTTSKKSAKGAATNRLSRRIIVKASQAVNEDMGANKCHLHVFSEEGDDLFSTLMPLGAEDIPPAVLKINDADARKYEYLHKKLAAYDLTPLMTSNFFEMDTSAPGCQ